MNPGLTKTYVASGAVTARALVKAGATDGTMAMATASTDAILGVAERLDVTDGERLDVIHTGIVEVSLGGTVTYGALLTAGANGTAVAAAPAAGVNAQIVGRALSAGVAGDIIDVLIILGQIQG